MDVFLVGSSVMLGESSGCAFQTYSHKSREIDTNSTFEFGHGRTVERRASASIGRRLSRAPLLPPNVLTGAQSGANCGISVPAVCVRRYPSQTGSRPSPTSSSVSTIRRRLEVVIPSDRHFSLPAPVLSPRSCASLGIAWSLHTSRLAAFVFPSTASPKAALRRSVVVRSTTITAVSSRTGEVPGACPHGPSAPVEPNRLYCQLQPSAAVSELSSFVSQLCLIGG